MIMTVGDFDHLPIGPGLLLDDADLTDRTSSLQHETLTPEHKVYEVNEVNFHSPKNRICVNSTIYLHNQP